MLHPTINSIPVSTAALTAEHAQVWQHREEIPLPVVLRAFDTKAEFGRRTQETFMREEKSSHQISPIRIIVEGLHETAKRLSRLKDDCLVQIFDHELVQQLACTDEVLSRAAQSGYQ